MVKKFMVSLLVAALVNTYCNCIRGEGYLLERRLGTIPILRQHTFGRFLTHPATHYTEVRFCQFLFRWIYYCHSSKSTGKETGKTHLCALATAEIISAKNALAWVSMVSYLKI